MPGAEQQKRACLDDLTTSGTVASGHTVPADYAGLHAAGTRNPSGVPGLQVDGYFPDNTTSNTNNGWNHDSQFVLRLPNRWNGKLVITGAPGNRRQYANDFVMSDWLVARGYAFASTDKGNTGSRFYRDGASPGDAIAEWNRRVKQLTRAAKAAVRLRYGRDLERTYITGLSNGGYLVRYALEHYPRAYDGGLDWEGNLFSPDAPQTLSYLPAALRHYPDWAATRSEAAHRAILAAGFQPGSEFLWDFHYRVYWDLTQRVYREELDPGWDGDLDAGIPFCRSGTPSCDADYDFRTRPAAVRRALAKVQNTGRIGRKLITLHGTLDTLLPIRVDSDAYRRMVRRAGRARIQRYYRIEAGTHVDSLYETFPDRLRPILPCYRTAFRALERWVEQGREAPRTQLVARPSTGDVLNTCALRR